MNGYDGSLMGSINAMKPWHTYFNTGMEGSGIGLVFAIYSVGNILGCLFAAPACDAIGRRFGMFTGSALIVMGTIIEACAKNVGTFMAGRFFIGFGVTIAVTAAPVYLVEMAYPTWRGKFGGLYNVVGYYVGALGESPVSPFSHNSSSLLFPAATWTCYGTGHLATNWSWRIPVIIQAVPSLLVMLFVWLLPESPRWLLAHDKADEGHRVLTTYHGNGNPDSAIVQLEMNEIHASITYNATLTRGQRWWDYRPLFQARANLYRLMLVLLVTTFSQFIGGAVISYYLPVILQNVGITSSSQQLLLNALNTVFSFLAGIAGAFTVDALGRRPLFLWGLFLTTLTYIPMNVIAARADGHVATGTGYAFIAMIFLYGIFWSFTWTPLQALYPSEILRNDVRAKGMAFQGLVSGLAGFINTYATPVALQNIGWKTYTIFLVFHAAMLVLMYFTVVETKGRNLEELEEIFNDPKPVKRSLERHEVVIRQGDGVKLELS